LFSGMDAIAGARGLQMIDGQAPIGQTCVTVTPFVLSFGPRGPESKDDASTSLTAFATLRANGTEDKTP